MATPRLSSRRTLPPRHTLVATGLRAAVLSAASLLMAAPALAQQAPAAQAPQMQMQTQQQATPPRAGGMPPLQERLQQWDMDRYVQFQQAIAAHQACRGNLSSGATQALTRHIETQTGEPTSPARKLAIMDDARFDMRRFAGQQGCGHARVKAALSLFDQQLAPAVRAAGMQLAGTGR